MTSQPSTPGVPTRNPAASLVGETKRRYVTGMFARIAGRYDLMNTLMTFGRDEGWRQLTVRAARPRAGGRALDMGTGTGRIAQTLAQRGASVWALDLTAEMMLRGRATLEEAGDSNTLRRLRFIQGDALTLPFADASFDCATSGFTLRNVTDVRQALAELCRVVKPGGRVVTLEASQPGLWPVRLGHRAYVRVMVPLLGLLIAGDADAYSYLRSSMLSFYDAPALAALMREVGLEQVRYKHLMFGSVAVHVGTRPYPHAR
ncbi:MAG TPA: ubiquinone/menaquinone biosynthesis methyltransferase [Chloroflexia bacterium]|nr:ubiquinone/menaquinone biosynthesis methyltransferase [Chloroflexia bacterium]